MQKTILFWGFLTMSFLLTACVGTQKVQRSTNFPSILLNNKQDISIAVYTFQNYTDTPQAGQRAANLMEGLLSAKGYSTSNRVEEHTRSRAQQRALTKSMGAQYMLVGGVTEWRYKTGIDGEPAISLQMKLIDVQNNRTVWSAAGSDNNWGNASIGTTAQGLYEDLLK